jgi:hypothetical protein
MLMGYGLTYNKRENQWMKSKDALCNAEVLVICPEAFETHFGKT